MLVVASHNTRDVKFVALLLVCALVGTGAAPNKKDAKKPTGSEKCEKGAFVSLTKDATIPLCDAHFPDAKAKSDWLVLFYTQDADDVQEVMNRVAMDFGNEPPQKSKQLKKPQKQRTRIKNLAEKYEFEAHIPKKGLEEKGKEPLLKVGAVCCDCSASGEQEVCKTREKGLHILRPGKKDVPLLGSENRVLSAENIMKSVMSELGFVKGQGPGEQDTKKAGEKIKPENANADQDNAVDLKTKLEELEQQKKKATDDEDFKLAGKLKKEIEALAKTVKNTEL